MKRIISLILALVLCLSLCACGKPEVEMVNSYMISDEKVKVEFKNVGRTTISYIRGSLNLFVGSTASQTSAATAYFEWEGTCEKGETISITAKVNNSKSGLENEVNRIGHSISEIS